LARAAEFLKARRYIPVISVFMRRYFIFVICSFLLIHKAKSQEVIWASKVLEYSSYANDAQYSPKNRFDQILGTPSVYPQMTASPCAWQPGGSDFGEDYIKVGFEKAIHVRQIAIVENWNPGAIGRIFGYDEQGKEYLLYQNSGSKFNAKKRFWRVFPEEIPQKINAIKILVVHRLSQGVKQYDAIAISDSDEFIDFKINLADHIPENIKKQNLGNVVNSAYGEVAPIITPDGKTLYFTRLNHPENIRNKKEKTATTGQDIWVSKLGEKGNWETPVNLGPPVNNELDNAAATASADGNSLYVLNVYTPSGSLLAGLSKTTFNGQEWGLPRKVEINGFQALGEYNPITKTTEIRTEYSISYDEEVLIMGLHRSQSYGGKDLYVSFKKPDGSYSSPVNMGSVINTADNEGSPFISADKKTLYFNSKGHPGYGDADIFVSRRLDDTWTNWSVPMNLGPEINSPAWDGYFSIPASGDFAYLSSQANTQGAEDIFKIELFDEIRPEKMVFFAGVVVNSETGEKLNVPLRVSYRDSIGKLINLELESDTLTGEQKGILAVNQSYIFNVNASGFFSLTDSLLFSEETTSGEIRKRFELLPLKEGQKMVLENLIFDQGRYEIRPESYAELERLTEIMNSYPHMRVLLEGHTDNQGDFTLNVELAENRVNAVKKYLVETGGIAADRIETKSWGPLKPVSNNVTPESRKKNRRVEFTILKM
jgi:outer membrane protein OmpA-like peptidoglycan-associated protein